MLRRHRQIRMQIHQLMDACLFALSFWLAYLLRSDSVMVRLLHLVPIHDPFDSFVWLYVILIPAAPLVLEAQGFYQRPILCSRRTTAWQLLKGCVFTTLGLVLLLFAFRLQIARALGIWFGGISFLLVFAKEELLRLAFRSKLAQAQHRRRFILVGESNETRQMREQFKTHSQEGVDILGEVDLSKTALDEFVEMLHEHSVNAVIL